ncbi:MULTISPECIES: serine hydrolase [unclassified Bacillus (in: firmicutes)]|uniref:serine hydrolase n=1 Tax=unclassified Bacillus (in: firmicutes) TaxID=185979 RepID=UPI0008E7BE0C|nr:MULTISPECIES: serine hydrolase [unclassified Bacillus (in: firmicutes)]SFI80831.1 Beta-lactamase enzyme family protein [Bacillus sp. 71mf]SFS85190.1 Beta-lactamase enzyme family protein [Bacillus sp. 103mf]
MGLKNLLIKDVQQLIPSSVEIGLYLYDTKTNETLCINENQKFPLASLTKWIVGSIAFQKSEHIAPMTIKEAIRKHSREAYDCILEKIDIREMNIELQHMKLDILVNKDNTNITKNCGTPASVFQFMKFLYKHEKENMFIFESLKEQEDPDGFQFSNQYEWLHMTGGLETVCNDVGYLYLEDRVLFCIGFVRAYDENTAWYQLEQVLKNIGELIVQTYKNKE